MHSLLLSPTHMSTISWFLTSIKELSSDTVSWVISAHCAHCPLRPCFPSSSSAAWDWNREPTSGDPHFLRPDTLHAGSLNCKYLTVVQIDVQTMLFKSQCISLIALTLGNTLRNWGGSSLRLKPSLSSQNFSKGSHFCLLYGEICSYYNSIDVVTDNPNRCWT